MKRGLIFALGLAVAAQAPAQPAPMVAPDKLAVPGAMQWLYGSGEGASAGIQTYHAFRDHAVAAARRRPKSSVVLAAGATLEAPRFVPCGRKPLAVVLDVDETALLNTGYEYDQAAGGRGYDSARWSRWEQTGADKVAPVPGAVTALGAIRRAGIRVIFNTNRNAANAAYSEAALNGAGVGPARHGETLYLEGDVAPGGAKDPRRAEIASHYCVVAMAGDQFADFTDLLNAKTLSVAERRRIASGGPIARLWGSGWFMLSNPVYGPSIRGSFDAVFPADKRWIDPQGPGDMAGIDQTIRAVYAVISGPPGQKRDFDRMRSLFAPNALLRAIGPKGVRGGTLDDYIARSGPILEKEGFTEQELGRRVELYGNLATVWSSYDGRTASGSFHERGINSFQLVKVDGKWLVASILWQEESKEFPLPQDMIVKR